MFEFKIEQGLDNLKEACEIREKVFMEEQGFENEFDDIDKIAYHVVVFDGEKPIATGRTYPMEDDNKTYAIGRIAVIKEYRGKHVGKLVIEKLEDKLKEIGVKHTELSAQTQAKGFYETLGYESFGEEYLDEHCPHIAMKKNI